MLVSASFLSNQYKPLELIKKFDKTNVDFIHVDIMDGKFVEEKSFTVGEVTKLSSYTTKKLDIHLMVSNPLKYIEDLAFLNVEYITFHYESVKDVQKTIDEIKNYGVKVGISIKPETNISEIFPYLSDIDQILIMSVNPGKSGQEFNEGVLYKIEALKSEIESKGYKAIISVDGGINNETAALVKEKGADMVVSASYIINDMNNIKLLKNI